MATAVTNQAASGSANVTKDESLSANVGGDLSAEIANQEDKLQMEDIGFDVHDLLQEDWYKHSERMIEDPRLKENEMYRKLVFRLQAFAINNEKIRKNGMTEQQQEVIRKSGYSQAYRQQLHKCLRELLIHIVNEKDLATKTRQLREIYTWYFYKLVAMGTLSKEEEEREIQFLNPMRNQLGHSMKLAIKQKVHSALCNTEAIEAANKSMFTGTKVVYDAESGDYVTVEDSRCA